MAFWVTPLFWAGVVAGGTGLLSSCSSAPKTSADQAEQVVQAEQAEQAESETDPAVAAEPGAQELATAQDGQMTQEAQISEAAQAVVQGAQEGQVASGAALAQASPITEEAGQKMDPSEGAAQVAAVQPSPLMTGSDVPQQESPLVGVAPAPEVKSAAIDREDSVEWKEYRVRPGDTLTSISSNLYGDPFEWDEIYQANKESIQDPNIIRSGMKLRYKVYPGMNLAQKKGHRYIIQPGDTLSQIAQAVYGSPSKWKAIWEYNSDIIHNPSKIMAGVAIYYTGGRVLASVSAHAPKSSDETPSTPESEQGD